MVVGRGYKVILLALFTEKWHQARILVHRYWHFEKIVCPFSE